MLLFLLFSEVKIHLFTDKENYLLGELISVSYYIANIGNKTEICEYVGARTLGSDNAYMWNDKGKFYMEGEPSVFIYVNGEFKKQLIEISPGDTYWFDTTTINLCFDLGDYELVKRKHNSLTCLPVGEYYYTIFVRFYENGKETKIWADTAHFTVEEPKDEKPFEYYKKIISLSVLYNFPDIMRYSLEFLNKFPESEYTDDIIHLLVSRIKVKCGEPGKKEDDIIWVKKYIDYLKNNIERFKYGYKGKALKDVILSLRFGWKMIGYSSKDIDDMIKDIKDELNVNIKEKY
uniref:Uncharacterized protein n=1 Tax=candidate division WOR-3 bacterium TaxID=2052148 RepID=A0A7C4UCJ9_UNCW3